MTNPPDTDTAVMTKRKCSIFDDAIEPERPVFGVVGNNDDESPRRKEWRAPPIIVDCSLYSTRVSSVSMNQ